MPFFLRILLLPFSLLYALGIWFRNTLYSSGLWSRTTFDLPVICVGNITAGGTGKTPHIEFLTEALKQHYTLAILSRGYKRKTTGYLLASRNSTAAEIGDEPYQLKKKYPDLAVAVCENRVLGVPNLLGDLPHTQVILMDDGFQHLAIKAGLNIVLTDYTRLFTRDYLLPAGLLREFKSGSERADVIIVTKCPDKISQQEQQQIISEIKPLPHQEVLFSTFAYETPVALNEAATKIVPHQDTEVIAFAGIGNPQPFFDHISTHYKVKKTFAFKDHQDYHDALLKGVAFQYNELNTSNKAVFTTEKDAVKQVADNPLFVGIPVFYIPIKVRFIGNGEQKLLMGVTDYINNTLALQEQPSA